MGRPVFRNDATPAPAALSASGIASDFLDRAGAEAREGEKRQALAMLLLVQGGGQKAASAATEEKPSRRKKAS